MLKRENRLSKIARSIGGKKYLSPLFSVRISISQDNNARFGFIVSKKIDKRAVVRNRTKRVLRDISGALIDRLAGKDVIIIAKKSLSPKDKIEASKELEGVLRKAV
jgi:ribonuclease P protein component